MRLREFPDPGKRPGGPGAKYRKHDRNAGEENANREPQHPSEKEVNNEEPAGETTRPVTNKDKEKIITNSDNNAYPMGEDEREGV
jgi:hypothetical protein